MEASLRKLSAPSPDWAGGNPDSHGVDVGGAAARRMPVYTPTRCISDTAVCWPPGLWTRGLSGADPGLRSLIVRYSLEHIFTFETDTVII